MPRRRVKLIPVTLESGRVVEFKLSPKAQITIAGYVNKAVGKNTIAPGRESYIAAQALTAAAIEQAAATRTRLVGVPHVQMGWRERLCVSRPDCKPPEECLFKSVIMREGELKERSAVFRQMMAGID